MWNPMALALREAPRRRRYQHDELDQFLT
jgi:hypothetical protein